MSRPFGKRRWTPTGVGSTHNINGWEEHYRGTPPGKTIESGFQRQLNPDLIDSGWVVAAGFTRQLNPDLIVLFLWRNIIQIKIIGI